MPIHALVSTLEQIASSVRLRGAILGTRGLAKGLDDRDLEAVWETAARLGIPLFVHPHYGLGKKRGGGGGTVWNAREWTCVTPRAGVPVRDGCRESSSLSSSPSLF